jgi:hypothetical protein
MVRRLILVLALVTMASPLPADDLLVPADTQLHILQNVWTLDRTFPRQRTVRVVILYQSKYGRSARMMEALMASSAGMPPAMRLIPVDLVHSIPIGQQIPADTDIVYVAPLRAVEISSIVRETRARHLRSVTPVADYVIEGVGLGIIVDHDRPRIMINVEASASEGADYSAQLLKLAYLVSRKS